MIKKGFQLVTIGLIKDMISSKTLSKLKKDQDKDTSKGY